MPRGRPRKLGIDEKALSKGELRKLTALRKSLGPEIASRAFEEWYSSQATDRGGEDKNAALIASALGSLIQEKNLHIPRSGYLLRRGRGRVIVETPDE